MEDSQTIIFELEPHRYATLPLAEAVRAASKLLQTVPLVPTRPAFEKAKPITTTASNNADGSAPMDTSGSTSATASTQPIPSSNSDSDVEKFSKDWRRNAFQFVQIAAIAVLDLKYVPLKYAFSHDERLTFKGHFLATELKL